MDNFYVFSILDILPYYLVLLYLLVIYVGKFNYKQKANCCFVAIFILAAIRYGVAYDYLSYKETLVGNVDEFVLNRYEPFSRVLVEIGRNTHFQLFFAIGSFLTIFPIYKICIHYSVDPALSLIVYYLHPSLYLEGLGIVRNAIAFSFVLYAFVKLQEKHLVWSLIFLACAVMFHKSALIGLLIYPLAYLPQSRKYYLLLYLSSFLISAIVAKLIGAYADQLLLLSDAQRYIVAGEDRSGGGMMTVIVNGICLLNFFFWDKLKYGDIRIRAYLCSYCLGSCLWNIFLPADNVMAGRFYLFFAFPLILIMPSYIILFRNRSIGKRVILLFFILLFSSHFYINIKSFLDHPSKMSTIPYQTIFWYTDYRNL